MQMKKFIFNVYMRIQDLRDSEEGQDLVEYALVVALIAFSAVTSMKALSGGINSAFSKISATLSSNIT
jgi:pilus assembly protein Flp/PilA